MNSAVGSDEYFFKAARLINVLFAYSTNRRHESSLRGAWIGSRRNFKDVRSIALRVLDAKFGGRWWGVFGDDARDVRTWPIGMYQLFFRSEMPEVWAPQGKANPWVFSVFWHHSNSRPYKILTERCVCVFVFFCFFNVLWDFLGSLDLLGVVLNDVYFISFFTQKPKRTDSFLTRSGRASSCSKKKWKTSAVSMTNGWSDGWL